MRNLRKKSDDAAKIIGDGMEAIYPELRKLAYRMKQGDGSWTINPTALVHEAYLHLASYQVGGFQSRAHLRNTVVLVMRRLLVDAARRRIAERRGGGEAQLSLEELTAAPAQNLAVSPEQVLDINLALEKLALENELDARVFEYHFFAGLTQEEIAEFVGISPKAISKSLRRAKARLAVELGHERAGGAITP